MFAVDCLWLVHFMVHFIMVHDGSLYDCLLDYMARVQSVDDKAVFVYIGHPNAHHSAWLESVSPTDRHAWRDALDFCNLSGCEQLVRHSTPIADKQT